jgi:hypothetical protein
MTGWFLDWDIVKVYLLELFAKIHAGQLGLFRINFGEIIILPKVIDEERI